MPSPLIGVNVYVGGVTADRQLKTTRLPASSESGRVITFETELIAAAKVRVTVEVCDKVITFDWNLPLASPMTPGGVPGLAGHGPGLGVLGAAGSTESDKVSLYFFTRLSHPGVSVTVD